ncbi:hypothetical protein SDC9_79696 [bioreactor metagenome]|uniref:Lipoprotein SmpA/OmlA domain-containing protein n=3 Tax=root TaxID=1 RepID=A0A0J7IW08_9FLAO|nr:hypothetical protein ACM44_11850 [Chryseobacterium koreense CCUG 49689]
MIPFLVTNCGKFSHEKFNSETWKNANLTSEENFSLRWDMMNDLRNHHQIIGMNKTEIKNLLGNPDSETRNEFNYYLGYSKHGINTGTLWLIFDKNNKVVKISVSQG